MIDKDTLYRLYVLEGTSARAIGRIYNCHHGVIAALLKEYDIASTYRRLPPLEIDRDTLYHLYVLEGKTSNEIADQLGTCTAQTVIHNLKKYGIPRRSTREAQRPIVPTKEELYELYVVQQLPIDSIGKQMRSSENSISRLLKEYSIPIRANTWKLHGPDAGPKQGFSCENCGKPFMRDPSRAKYGRGKHCSPKCQYESSKKRADERKIPIICIGCGEKFKRSPSQLQTENGAGKYCSRECRDEYRIGEQHPQWLGGEPYKRGPNWHAQRREAMKRDNHTCQHCGEPGEHVHHKVPFRFFGLERYKEANRLSNLITLCEPCHRKADAAIQRAG